MNDTTVKTTFSQRSPWYQLITSLLVVVGMGTVILLIVLIPGLFLFDFDSTLIKNGNYDALKEDDINFLRYLLLSQDICIFIIPGIYLLNKMNKVISLSGIYYSRPLLREAGLIILLMVCLAPVIAITSQLNSAIHFPGWLSGLESWMIEKENEAGNILNLIVASKTTMVFIFNLFLIAILPAIGEEIIFRGVFQNIFQRLFRNDRFGIIVTAFLFSAIHMQFFGFIPRFILGLVLGYLYYYSGNLWMPVIAHFVNNASAVIVTFVSDEADFSIHSEPIQWTQLLLLPASILIMTMILIYFRRKASESLLSVTDNTESGLDKE